MVFTQVKEGENNTAIVLSAPLLSVEFHRATPQTESASLDLL